MPNHVLNKVTISGSKSDIAKCKKQILNAYKGDNGETMNFSFNTIIPMPESLNIESSTIVEDAIKYISSNFEDIPNGWEELSEDELERRTELGRKAIKNIELYEAKDWYDWRVKNWGTKWDCYETVVEDSECSIYLEFWTAWSSPYPMDKRLELTKEQLEAVKKYNEAVKGLVEANIICILRPEEFDSDIYAINAKHVYKVSNEEDDFGGEFDDESEEFTTVSIDEPEVIACPFAYGIGFLDEYFRVQFA